MSFFLGLRKLGLALIARGLGFVGGAPPAPPVIVGPCISGEVEDAFMLGALGEPEIAGELQADVSFSAPLGDVQIFGVLGDIEIEGTAIDGC